MRKSILKICKYLEMQWAAVRIYKSLTRTPPQNPAIESLVFLNGPVLWSAAIQGNSLWAVGNPLTILARSLLLGMPQPNVKITATIDRQSKT